LQKSEHQEMRVMLAVVETSISMHIEEEHSEMRGMLAVVETSIIILAYRR